MADATKTPTLAEAVLALIQAMTATAEAATKAIPLIQNAVSTFEVHGPMGIHGESKPAA